MEASSIVTLISNVGFPIACCCAMFWYINNTMKEFTKTIAENNRMLEKLCTKLDEIKERDHD